MNRQNNYFFGQRFSAVKVQDTGIYGIRHITAGNFCEHRGLAYFRQYVSDFLIVWENRFMDHRRNITGVRIYRVKRIQRLQV